MLRQTFVTIDMDAIRHNYLVMRGAAPASVRVMPVIKADAYGHGMLAVAKALSRIGATDFAVATPDEGVALRDGGIDASVLVLGAATPRAAETAIASGLTQTVFTSDMVRLLDAEAQRQGKTALVHIKLDTGMNRIGLRTEAEADELAQALAQAGHVRATGIYTHFADADNPPETGAINEFTRSQLARFKALRARFSADIPAHVANSAMSLAEPQAYFDMIREGISLYGYPPVVTSLGFRPALRWLSEVTHVKTVEAGETVSYGRTYTVERTMRLATVAVGYGDGYLRAASNRGYMLVAGVRAPIVGRVCMDQTMLDVTDIPEAQTGSEVVIIGAQGKGAISAEEQARWAGTISYETLLAITPRVPRVYINADE